MPKTSTATIILSKTQIRQLLTYCQWVKDDGEYYGYKPLFESRHKNMVDKLQKAIESLEVLP